ncbi:MAG: hypothetical protein ACK475_01080, partial [Bacteroidota bacterium]
MSPLPPAASACVATFSKPPKGAAHARIVVHAERDARGWQVRIVRFTERQSFTDPACDDIESVESLIERFLDDGWGQVLLQTPDADVHILQKFKQGAWKRTMRNLLIALFVIAGSACSLAQDHYRVHLDLAGIK